MNEQKQDKSDLGVSLVQRDRRRYLNPVFRYLIIVGLGGAFGVLIFYLLRKMGF